MSNIDDEYNLLQFQYESLRLQRDKIAEMQRMKKEMAELQAFVDEKVKEFPAIVLQKVSALTLADVPGRSVPK